MKKAELIAVIVPATIAQWTAETPQYSHKGKERELNRMFWTWSKKDLETKLFYPKQRGYAAQ